MFGVMSVKPMEVYNILQFHSTIRYYVKLCILILISWSKDLSVFVLNYDLMLVEFLFEIHVNWLLKVSLCKCVLSNVLWHRSAETVRTLIYSRSNIYMTLYLFITYSTFLFIIFAFWLRDTISYDLVILQPAGNRLKSNCPIHGSTVKVT